MTNAGVPLKRDKTYLITGKYRIYTDGDMSNAGVPVKRDKTYLITGKYPISIPIKELVGWLLLFQLTILSWFIIVV